MNFSEQFKEARKATGLSQAKLAEEMLIPRRNIEDWERGITSPPEWCQRLLLDELVRMRKGW